MLRLLVLVLALANIGFYAWTQGKLDGIVGAKPQGDREPERLQRQVRPETLQVLPPVSASAAATVAAAEPAPACLEAGPYTPTQIGPAESVLQTVLPAGSWANLKTEVPAVWILYMGKYPNHDALVKKADELKRLKVPAEEVRNAPELEQGLSLGRFDNRPAADKALADLAQRGVRTARVVSLTPAAVSHTLRVERADAALQARLAGLRADALLGKPFTACSGRN